MKKFVLFSCISLFGASAFAQHEGHNHDLVPAAVDSKSASATPAKVPDMSLSMKEEVYDFGKIPQGKPVHHNFEFANAGTTPLKLVNVQASCGCTTPEWEKDKEIPAGGTSTIKVGYNAAAEGPFTKMITITYNDNQTKQITIKGEVWKTPAASAPVNQAASELKN